MTEHQVLGLLKCFYKPCRKSFFTSLYVVIGAIVLFLTFSFVHATEYHADHIIINNQPEELNRIHGGFGRTGLLRSISVEGLGFVDIEVRAVDVYKSTSRIIIDDGMEIDPPDTLFLRGVIRGIPDSVVALTVTHGNDIMGLATDGSTVWEVHRDSLAQPLDFITIEANDDTTIQSQFQCGNDHLFQPHLLDFDRLRQDFNVPQDLPQGQFYQVTVAIDTDHQFFQIFGNSVDTANYIGTLFNYISGVYETEAQTRLMLGDIFLWPTTDPWVENGSTSCRLHEFGLYWKNNRSDVDRTIAHFLSGRSLGGGIAWLDALCLPPTLINYPTGCASLGNQYVYGDFGVSANMTGTMQTPSGIAWDAVVVAHEIGHNFGSPHTHCYGGISGISNPVDACYGQESSCWTGNESLPGLGSLTGGSPYNRNGTIMSYCHLHEGGILNIAGTFGLNHPYGISPDRVPNLILGKVANTSSSNPSCIPIVDSGEQAPLVTTNSASGIGQTTATLNATVNPNGANTSAYFEYGTTTTYGQSTTSVGVGSGTSNTPVSQNISGLQCDTTYQFQAIASNAGGTTLGGNQSFSTMQCSGDGNILSNGEPVEDLSGDVGSEMYFSIEVPSGATNLLISTSGGTGDADLYVRFGALPTLDDWDCRPFRVGNDEQCEFSNPTQGTYHVMLHGWTAYSGVTLVASYDASACPHDEHLLLQNATVTGSANHEACRTITAGSGYTVSATGNATFRAGEQIILMPGFVVEMGGTFKAEIDPNLKP